MNSAPAYSAGPAYLPKEASVAEKPPVAMVAIAFTTESRTDMPRAE